MTYERRFIWEASNRRSQRPQELWERKQRNLLRHRRCETKCGHCKEIRKKYADVGEIVYKRYVDGDTMDEELTKSL